MQHATRAMFFDGMQTGLSSHRLTEKERVCAQAIHFQCDHAKQHEDVSRVAKAKKSERSLCAACTGRHAEADST